MSFYVYIIYTEICIGKADGLPSAYSVIFRLYILGRHIGRPLLSLSSAVLHIHTTTTVKTRCRLLYALNYRKSRRVPVGMILHLFYLYSFNSTPRTVNLFLAYCLICSYLYIILLALLKALYCFLCCLCLCNLRSLCGFLCKLLRS